MTRLTHLDEKGAARMVDVSAKPTTRRTATAEGRIIMKPEALAAIAEGSLGKGDALATARIAGIMAAKRIGELIPLCHPLGLDTVTVDFHLADDHIAVTAKAGLAGKTGVEMEALTAASVALLTLYDMAKAVDRSMVISDVRLVEKTGGKSGDWKAED
ncbi:cyclic pyranopterin monophosphate synthase MoaC [Qipengyuania gaetbuli]|uniref:cyclic pyranopterin monophosphate synthase MoaC n=1 Tax=Qipengyuania gaetbuli TaxID=266952 RepID=UPI001CD6A0B2|nr:cyclic pyranopterin monophosphate synthase MoaC [Qipengyuania gaetbuli]MCA0911351.1 cyclic pyranopterin monophosphate synthase MoaC [Qipengyuania gaetbuli]